MSLPVDPAVEQGVRRLMAEQMAKQMLEGQTAALGGSAGAPYTALFSQVLADAVAGTDAPSAKAAR